VSNIRAIVYKFMVNCGIYMDLIVLIEPSDRISSLKKS